MSSFLPALAVSAAVCVVLTSAGMPMHLDTDGHCWTNGTHYGVRANHTERLPTCYVALCYNESKRATIGTPCSAGPDILYGQEELTALTSRHCYPSARGELPGDQCCGGYPICFRGNNSHAFKLRTYLKTISRISCSTIFDILNK